LKPSFNKSGESYRSTPQKALPSGTSRERKQQGRAMTTMTSASLSSAVNDRGERFSPFAEIRAFWRQFFARAFDPYRPELHYMRGPGPAWRAKHVAASPPHST
jgi:hypothetical protein